MRKRHMKLTHQGRNYAKAYRYVLNGTDYDTLIDHTVTSLFDKIKILIILNKINDAYNTRVQQKR